MSYIYDIGTQRVNPEILGQAPYYNSLKPSLGEPNSKNRDFWDLNLQNFGTEGVENFKMLKF